jgi:diaminopimelate epimerase
MGGNIVAVVTGRAHRLVRVEVPGGELDAQWDDKTNHVFLTGPAVEVMEGVFAIK